MFGVSKRGMSDTPIEDAMNSDTLTKSAVSFVLSVGVFLSGMAVQSLQEESHSLKLYVSL